MLWHFRPILRRAMHLDSPQHLYLVQSFSTYKINADIPTASLSRFPLPSNLLACCLKRLEQRVSVLGGASPCPVAATLAVRFHAPWPILCIGEQCVLGRGTAESYEEAAEPSQ